MNPKLQVIYDQIPKVVCKGLCHAACGPVPTTASEREEIRKITGRRVKTEPQIFQDQKHGPRILKTNEDANCLYLKKNRCTVYEARPIVCRLYGVADGLRCQHGCQPERSLSPDEAYVLIDQVHGVK